MKVLAILLCVLLWSCGSKPEPASTGPDLVSENNRGVALMGYFDYGAAEAAFRSLVEADPDRHDVKVNLAIATLNLQTEGSEQRALELLSEVIAARPENLRAHYCSGLLKLYLGDAPAAQPFFEKVTAGDPQDPYAAYYMAQCLVRQGQTKQALPWYEKAVALDSYLRSAWYGLFQAAQRSGDKQRAAECLAVFQKLKGNPKARQVEFKYTRMGPKGTTETLDGPKQTSPTPEGTLFVQPAAIQPPAGMSPAKTDVGGVSVADLDGDGDLDLFAAAALVGDTTTLNGVYLKSETGYTADPAHPLAVVDGVNAAICGDVDNNGTVDVYLLRQGENQLFARSPEGVWTNLTQTAGVGAGRFNTVDGAWLDADHDGDLDLFLINADGPNELLNNNGDGSFQPLAEKSGLAGAGQSRRIVSLDLDRDRDTDLIVINENPPHEVYLNDRLWAWRPAQGFDKLINQPISTAIAADIDADGYFELVTSSGGSVSHWGRGDDGKWQVLRTVDTQAGDLTFLDINGDGNAELVGCGEAGLTVTNWDGLELYRDPRPLQGGVPLTTTDGSGPAMVTVDNEGALALYAPGPGRYPFVAVAFTGMEDASQSVRSNALGIGTAYAARFGSRWTAGRVGRSHGGPGGSCMPINLGLAGAKGLDFIAMTWSDGVFQTELDLAVNQYHVLEETQRQLSSCPVLFADNGLGFQFVSDILGVGGMGYAVGPGQYASPRPHENFLLPPGALPDSGSQLRLKVAEPMEESCYLDHVGLRYYDLPPGWSMVLDERMGTGGPEVSGEPRFYREEVQPTRATDGRGVDVTDALLTRNNIAVPLPPLDSRYIGFLAVDQELTIRFEEPLDSREGQPLLMIDGWVEYPYSQTNFAAWQAGQAARPPTLSYQTQAGEWRVLHETFGYPAGMPRRMSLPLRGLPKGVTSLRLDTNQEIYWDRISVVYALVPPQFKSEVLPLRQAELRAEGFAKRTNGPQRRPWYDDAKRAPLWDTRHQSGMYSRLGDVTDLLTENDSALCIFGPGEAVTLTYDAAAAPASGWVRRYVVESAGWCKDMDLYTRDGDTVDPLPGEASPARARLHPKYLTRLK